MRLALNPITSKLNFINRAPILLVWVIHIRNCRTPRRGSTQPFSDRERMDKLKKSTLSLSKSTKVPEGSTSVQPSTSSTKQAAKRSRPTTVKGTSETNSSGRSSFFVMFLMVLDTVQDRIGIILSYLYIGRA